MRIKAAIAASLCLFFVLSPAFGNEPSKSQSNNEGIGITHVQLMYQFDKDITLTQLKPVNGRECWKGRTKSGLCSIEVIGPQSNIYKATIFIYNPKSAALSEQAWNAIRMTKFITNVSPGWDDAMNWVNPAVNEILRHEANVRTTVQQGKLYTIRNAEPRGFTISVQSAQ